jgi:hypothetical protein
MLTAEWTAVSDASGIARYEWWVEYFIYGGYSTFAGGSVTSSSSSASAKCGYSYRWHVRAVDNAGNVGAYSDYAYFSMANPIVTDQPPIASGSATLADQDWFDFSSGSSLGSCAILPCADFEWLYDPDQRVKTFSTTNLLAYSSGTTLRREDCAPLTEYYPTRVNLTVGTVICFKRSDGGLAAFRVTAIDAGAKTLSFTWARWY